MNGSGPWWLFEESSCRSYVGRFEQASVARQPLRQAFFKHFIFLLQASRRYTLAFR